MQSFRSVKQMCNPPEGGGAGKRHYREYLVGAYGPVPEMQTLFQSTLESTPVYRPGLWENNCYHYLD